MTYSDSDVLKVVAAAVMGVVGGAVRICSSEKPYSAKGIIGSLMVSTFVAMILGSFIHEKVSDPAYLCALAGMAGYCGQVLIALMSKAFLDSMRNALGVKK